MTVSNFKNAKRVSHGPESSVLDYYGMVTNIMAVLHTPFSFPVPLSSKHRELVSDTLSQEMENEVDNESRNEGEESAGVTVSLFKGHIYRLLQKHKKSGTLFRSCLETWAPS